MQEKEELPSDVSENAWDEVPKYQAMKYKYDQAKEKESRMLKKTQVMQTLSEQVEEHRRQKFQV